MPSVIFRIRRPCLIHPFDISSHSLQILDHLPHGVFSLGHKGSVVFWNYSLEDWTGVLKSMIAGIPLETDFPPRNTKIYLTS